MKEQSMHCFALLTSTKMHFFLWRVQHTAIISQDQMKHLREVLEHSPNRLRMFGISGGVLRVLPLTGGL